MTKYFLVMMLLWLSSVAVNAEQLVGFGIKAGICLSGQNYPSLSGALPQSTTVGADLGLFSDLRLLDFLSLQLETNYIQKGQTIPNILIIGNGVSGYGTYEALYGYLEVPLLVKLQTKLSRDWTIYVLGGPSLSFLLNETTSASANNSALNESYDQTSLYPGTDWTLNVGGGIEFDDLIFDIRYGAGLNTAQRTIDGPSNYGHNSAVSFQLGYRLF